VLLSVVVFIVLQHHVGANVDYNYCCSKFIPSPPLQQNPVSGGSVYRHLKTVCAQIQTFGVVLTVEHL
jgi:hypothetical protein